MNLCLEQPNTEIFRYISTHKNISIDICIIQTTNATKLIKDWHTRAARNPFVTRKNVTSECGDFTAVAFPRSGAPAS